MKDCLRWKAGGRAVVSWRRLKPFGGPYGAANYLNIVAGNFVACVQRVVGNQHQHIPSGDLFHPFDNRAATIIKNEDAWLGCLPVGRRWTG